MAIGRFLFGNRQKKKIVKKLNDKSSTRVSQPTLNTTKNISQDEKYIYIKN